ncbi:hypothetical protein [Haladaptatus salinisoli]|uniref:hypothetical protein n=1 Tax=Haladaptatus salinisoli TaxID=2884876 RepID=UPI001D0B54E0|nr:hypothetical protein [Haladaptatus salinisoli]
MSRRNAGGFRRGAISSGSIVEAVESDSLPVVLGFGLPRCVIAVGSSRTVEARGFEPRRRIHAGRELARFGLRVETVSRRTRVPSAGVTL